MKKIILIFLSFVLTFSFYSCDVSNEKGNESTIDQIAESTAENTNLEVNKITNTNFASTSGSVLYNEGYTYFISGSTALIGGGANEDGIHTAEYELLRISDDKTSYAEVIRSFNMKMPLNLFFANGRVWFTEADIDSEKGTATSLSVSSVLPDGSEYKTFPCETNTALAIGCSNGKIYFRQVESTSSLCFNTNEEKWEVLPAIDSDGKYPIRILTVDEKGYAYYGKVKALGGGEEIGLWRKNLNDGEPELLKRFTNTDEFEIEAYALLVTSDYFYFSNGDSICSLSLSSGEIQTVIENADSDTIFSCNATDDGFYYITSEGLFFLQHGESNPKLMIQNKSSENKFHFLALCGDWVVYTNYHAQDFYRVSISDTKLSDAYFYRKK